MAETFDPNKLLAAVRTYSDIVNDLKMMPHHGLRKFYVYHLGTGRMSPSIGTSDTLSERQDEKTLIAFGNRCVRANVDLYIQLLTDMLVGEYESRLSHPKRVTFSDATMSGIRHLAEMINPSRPRVIRDRDAIREDIKNTMDSVAIMAVGDAHLLRKGRLSNDEPMILLMRAKDALDRLSPAETGDYILHRQYLRILYNATCLAFNVSASKPRLAQANPPPMDDVVITTSTLATLPLATRDFAMRFSEPEFGTTSRRGIEYILATEELMMGLRQ